MLYVTRRPSLNSMPQIQIQGLFYAPSSSPFQLQRIAIQIPTSLALQCRRLSIHDAYNKCQHRPPPLSSRLTRLPTSHHPIKRDISITPASTYITSIIVQRVYSDHLHRSTSCAPISINIPAVPAIRACTCMRTKTSS